VINRKIISELELYINLCYAVKPNNRQTLLARKQISETLTLHRRTQARNIPQSIAGTSFLYKDRIFMILCFFYGKLEAKSVNPYPANVENRVSS